jgi:hypothetical protein
MTIERTATVLSELLEARKEALEGDMTEVPMLAIPAETAQAIKNAVITLEGLRILKGAYTED